MDKKKIKQIPLQKTLILINNFVANTAGFFNSFSETVEKKISHISNRITELEILLSFMEAKLNSIPGLEDVIEPNEARSSSLPQENLELPVSNHSNFPRAGNSDEIDVAAPAAAQSEGTKASDHPEYAQFFKLLKLGVPITVVQAKVIAANLDPSVIIQPDLII
mmetsp:Transcript_1792/g.2468  ORF Transcript_1792/g.2468 Transcript_1792/m.2468 type:complete len:164 (+) Transcript_1792:27-518(+)